MLLDEVPANPFLDLTISSLVLILAYLVLIAYPSYEQLIIIYNLPLQKLCMEVDHQQLSHLQPRPFQEQDLY